MDFSRVIPLLTQSSFLLTRVIFLISVRARITASDVAALAV